MKSLANEVSNHFMLTLHYTFLRKMLDKCVTTTMQWNHWPIKTHGSNLTQTNKKQWSNWQPWRHMGLTTKEKPQTANISHIGHPAYKGITG